MKKDIFDFLNSRGFVYQYTNLEQLKKKINQKVSFYIGFDPTADSLHVGHFLTLMVVKHLQQAGNTPVIVIGGATAAIGDPSGRNTMRKMLSNETINKNFDSIKKQMEKFVSFEGENKAIILNNSDWLSNINWIWFLKEFGSLFSVNSMLSTESFKNRLNSETGLSFLEFNYILLQAYDFYFLNKQYNVELQIGGSDQWSNILSGIHLIKRKLNKEVFALTLNLLTKHDGTKMGKTSNGAIWLDENKTSPYEFYQYWLNVHDLDLKKLFLLLTDFEKEKIDDLCNKKGKEILESKKILAYELTSLIHGKQKANKAVIQSKSAFENVGSDLFEIVINKNDLNDKSLANILVKAKLSPSKSESKRLIKSNAIKINDLKIVDENITIDQLDIENKYNFILHKGKKHRFRVLIK